MTSDVNCGCKAINQSIDCCVVHSDVCLIRLKTLEDSFSHDMAHFLKISLVMERPVFRVSNHILHNSGCTIKEDGKRYEI